MFGFNRGKRRQLTNAEKDYVQLQGEIERLKAQKDTMSINLDNDRKVQDMALREEKHAHELTKRKYEQDMEQLKDKLEKEHELKMTEATTLNKLESQQKIAQAEIDHKQEVQEMKVKFAKDKAEYESRLNKEYMDKYSEALDELHTKGNITTKFLSDMSLKLLDKTPVGDKLTIENVSTKKTRKK